MRIEHQPESCRFVAIAENSDEMGEMEYAPHGKVISAIHTYTDEKYRGQGVASAMLQTMVGHARKHDWKIIPVCSYVRSAFAKDPEGYADVLANTGQ